jgi:hypothetical protein
VSTENGIALTPDHQRVWMLLLIRGATVAGLTPLPVAVFHRLVFLSNTLARLYDTAPPSEFVLKHNRGPYYPGAQFEVERLAIQGLVDLRDMRWSNESTDGQLDVKFSLTQSGRSLAAKWVKDSAWCRQVLDFLTDLCVALGSVEEGAELQSADHDLTYNQRWASPYAVISFRNPMEQLSQRAAEEIANAAPAGAVPGRQHQLHLYLKYLERLAA